MTDLVVANPGVGGPSFVADGTVVPGGKILYGRIAWGAEGVALTSDPYQTGSNSLRVSVVEGAQTLVDNSLFTAGSNGGLPIMGYADPGSAASVTAGNAGAVLMSPYRLIYNAGFPRWMLVQSLVISLTGTLETDIIAAAGAGFFLDMLSLDVYNGHATTASTLTIRDAAAGTARRIIPLQGGQGSNKAFGDAPLLQATANNKWTVQASVAVSTIYVHAQFVKRPS